MSRIEDLKETAACGMVIHYTVDKETDFVTYNDINGRGEYRYSEKCHGCSWRSICQPTEADYLKILSERLGREVKPLEVIAHLFNKREDYQNGL